MKVKLQVTKDGSTLFTEAYDVVDADSFGKACADAWWKLRQEQLAGESSIGALMEHLDSSVLDRLDGAQIRLDRA